MGEQTMQLVCLENMLLTAMFPTLWSLQRKHWIGVPIVRKALPEYTCTCNSGNNMITIYITFSLLCIASQMYHPNYQTLPNQNQYYFLALPPPHHLLPVHPLPHLTWGPPQMPPLPVLQWCHWTNNPSHQQGKWREMYPQEHQCLPELIWVRR